MTKAKPPVVAPTYGGDIVPKVAVKDDPAGVPRAKGKTSRPFPMRKDKSGSGFLKGKR